MHQAARAQQGPRHALAPQRRSGPQAQLECGGVERGQPLRTGQRQAAEHEPLANRLAGRRGERHQRGRQIGQVGPGVRHVQRARVGPSALGQRRGDHPVEPAAAAGAEVLPRGQDGRADVAARAAPRDGLLHRESHLPQGRRRPARGRWRQPLRHGRTVGLHVARQQQPRLQPLRHRQARQQQRHRFVAPALQTGVQRVQHHARPVRLRGQQRGVGHGGLQHHGACRQIRARVPPDLRQDAPAGRVEGPGRGPPQTPVGAQDQDDRCARAPG